MPHVAGKLKNAEGIAVTGSRMTRLSLDETGSTESSVPTSPASPSSVNMTPFRILRSYSLTSSPTSPPVLNINPFAAPMGHPLTPSSPTSPSVSYLGHRGHPLTPTSPTSPSVSYLGLRGPPTTPTSPTSPQVLYMNPSPTRPPFTPTYPTTPRYEVPLAKEWTRAGTFIDDQTLLQVGLWGKMSMYSTAGLPAHIHTLPDITDIWHVSASPQTGIVAMIDRNKNLLHLLAKGHDNSWNAFSTSTLGTPCRVAVTPSGKYVYTLDNSDSVFHLSKWAIDTKCANSEGIVMTEAFQLDSLKDLSDLCATYDDKAAILASGPSHAEIHIYESQNSHTTVHIDIDKDSHGEQPSRLNEFTALSVEENGSFLLAKRSGLVSRFSANGDHEEVIVQCSADGGVLCISRLGKYLALCGEKGVAMYNIWWPEQ